MHTAFIQFTEVRKKFGSLVVLNGVNLTINKGEITVIIGKSGTGKSVLLKHIVGLVQEDSGQLLIQGEPLNRLPRKKALQFQKSMSYMFQDNALFDFLTVFDNIALPLKETSRISPSILKEKVHTRMSQLSIEGIDHKYPSELSGGMRKRVALARALVTNPEVILFDEPTAGLDPVRKKNVHHMIREYQKKFGFTAVIVSHDIPEIFDLAQHIAFLDEGIIAFEGSKQEIMESDMKSVHGFIRGKDIRNE
ncbi:MAG: ABC transporter ATP-binding protein [Desulfotignum sp.]|nr:ATP-binding cassette domain-containing protein [Desulfobacteraceae bacterium]